MTRNIKNDTLGHVPYIYNKCLQSWRVQRNCNAPREYTGRSGKEEVTIEHSYILWELLKALHMT
jgi:hypothetical protein